MENNDFEHLNGISDFEKTKFYYKTKMADFSNKDQLQKNKESLLISSVFTNRNSAEDEAVLKNSEKTIIAFIDEIADFS
ncbi:hypothetical protein MHBO_001566 [Bonamia ostreae]|uniref:Uncharacterized protein n=1 Tax=Bonamia ostreae TaxID=126728 RepID=A0ABV2AJD9_9EUKA